MTQVIKVKSSVSKEYLLVFVNSERLDPFPMLKEIILTKKFMLENGKEFQVKIEDSQSIVFPSVRFINEIAQKQVHIRSAFNGDIVALKNCLKNLYDNGWDQAVKPSFKYQIIDLITNNKKKQIRKNE